MSEHSELVKRLRANTEKYPGFRNLNTDAADAIEQLSLDNKTLGDERDSLRRKMRFNRKANENLPDGYEAVEAYANDKEVVVMGTPDSDDESHNCDALGCGSIGSHVIARFSLTRSQPQPSQEKQCDLCGKPCAVSQGGKRWCRDHAPAGSICTCKRDHVNDDEHAPDCGKVPAQPSPEGEVERG